MKVKDLILEGIEYRGVRADAFGVTNTKFFNRHINANKVLKTGTGWTKAATDSFRNYLDDWSKIILKGQKIPVTEMNVDELFGNKALIQELAGHDWKGKAGVSKWFNQLSASATERGFTNIGKPWKTVTGKGAGAIKGLGTSVARLRKDVPPHIYKIIKDIEQTAFTKSIDKLTAEFMNITGHRGPETAKLNIENFKRTLATEQGSNYGLKKWNLHATGWEMKEGSKKIGHFSKLGKIVIYNALLLAEEAGRTSGPLFPNAQAVEDVISTALGDRLGLIKGYTEGVGEKVLTAGRTLYRNLSKGRILSTGEITEFSGSRVWDDTRKILEGGKASTSAGYKVVGSVESSVNRLGEAVDDQYIAYSDHRSQDDWVKRNNYKVPPKRFTLRNTVIWKYVQPNEYFMDWMGNNLRGVYESGKRFIRGRIPYTDANPEEIMLEKTQSAAEGTVDTKKRIYDAYKQGKVNKSIAIKELMADEGLTKSEATKKYNQLLEGKLPVEKGPWATRFAKWAAKTKGMKLPVIGGVIAGSLDLFGDKTAYAEPTEQELRGAGLSQYDVDQGRTIEEKPWYVPSEQWQAALGEAFSPIGGRMPFGTGTTEERTVFQEARSEREAEEERRMTEMKGNLVYQERQKEIKRAFEEEERLKLQEEEKEKRAEAAKKEEEWRASDKGFLGT
jgi:hypothetical protein